MPNGSDTASFSIYHRNGKGKPDRVYPWDGAVATYIVASINICRGMLMLEHVRVAFRDVVREFKDGDPDPEAWYRNEDEMLVANSFIEAILFSFPPVFVDDFLYNPNVFMASQGRPWHESFDTQDQSITINGADVRCVCRAARMTAENIDPHKRYRTFMFVLGNKFMHQLGHLFVTYLSKGQGGAETQQSNGLLRGEAGIKLEQLIFGGFISQYHNLEDGDGQAGVPYLRTERGLFKIDEDTIERTINHDFSFPYATCVDPETNLPPNPVDGWLNPVIGPDPLAQPETAILREEYPKPSPLFVGPGSNTILIPSDPTLPIYAEGELRELKVGTLEFWNS